MNIRQLVCLLLVSAVVACGHATEPDVSWDFDGFYEGTFRFQYDDSTYPCDGYTCGGQTLARYDCPATAQVTEDGDSTVLGVLWPDLPSCVETLTFPDDTTTYLVVADTIPFMGSITFMDVEQIRGFLHPDGYRSFYVHGDLAWGTGSPDDFERLLGCTPIESPIGEFYGGDPASFPPYERPGVRSMIAGRTYSAREVRCNGRRMHLLDWFDVNLLE